jgi:hypothetical protein
MAVSLGGAMRMGTDVTHSGWVPYVDTNFRTGELVLTLAEVTDEVRGGPFVSYSLLFRSEQPVVVPQGTYLLTTHHGEERDVFLVPLSEDTFESVQSHAAPDESA